MLSNEYNTNICNSNEMAKYVIPIDSITDIEHNIVFDFPETDVMSMAQVKDISDDTITYIAYITLSGYASIIQYDSSSTEFTILKPITDINAKYLYANKYAFCFVSSDGDFVPFFDTDNPYYNGAKYYGASELDASDGLSYYGFKGPDTDIPPIKYITMTEGAFCAIMDDKTIRVWGNPNYGGATTDPELSSFELTYFSLKGDGSVVIDVADKIYANKKAFCILHTSGLVHTWGDPIYGGSRDATVIIDGNTCTGPDTNGVITGVEKVYVSENGFCAFPHMKSWGSLEKGFNETGDVSTIPFDTVNNYTYLFPNNNGFCGLYDIEDQNVFVSGLVNSGANVDSGVDVSGINYYGYGFMSDVINIVGNVRSYCAIKNDNSVVVWGSENYGGYQYDGSNSVIGSFKGPSGDVGNPLPLENIINVVQMNGAYCAVSDSLSENTISVWGNSLFGGSDVDGSFESDLFYGCGDVTNVFKVFRILDSGFCAIKKDNTITMWGKTKNSENQSYHDINAKYRAFGILLDPSNSSYISSVLLEGQDILGDFIGSMDSSYIREQIETFRVNEEENMVFIGDSRKHKNITDGLTYRIRTPDPTNGNSVSISSTDLLGNNFYIPCTNGEQTLIDILTDHTVTLTFLDGTKQSFDGESAIMLVHYNHRVFLSPNNKPIKQMKVGNHNFTLLPSSIIINYNICLVKNTPVSTPNGWINVENLRTGDLILTKEGRRVQVKIIRYETELKNDTYPMLIPKHSITPNYPPKDFIISQKHPIYFDNKWIIPIRCMHKYGFKMLETHEIQHLMENNKIIYYHVATDDYVNDTIVIAHGTIVDTLNMSGVKYKFVPDKNMLFDKVLASQMKPLISTTTFSPSTLIKVKPRKDNKIRITSRKI